MTLTYDLDLDRSNERNRVFYTTEECGLYIHPKYSFLGASPDRLVFDQTAAPKKGLEVKCLFGKRNETVVKACEDKNVFASVVDGKIRLKRNHNYHYEVIISMIFNIRTNTVKKSAEQGSSHCFL